MKFTDLRVQSAIGSELDVTAVMVDCVRSRARHVEDTDLISARIAGCGIASNMPLRIILRITIRIVDIDVAIGGKGWVKGYAQKYCIAVCKDRIDGH